GAEGGRDAAIEQYVVCDVCNKWKWLARARKDPLCRCGDRLLQGDEPGEGVDSGASTPGPPPLQKILGALQGLLGPPQLAKFKEQNLSADALPERETEPDAAPALSRSVGLAKRALQRAIAHKKERQHKVGQLKEQLAQAEANLDVAVSQEQAAKQEAARKSQQWAELVNPDGAKCIVIEDESFAPRDQQALQAFLAQHPQIAAKCGQQVPKAAAAPVGPQGAARAAAAAASGAPPAARGPAAAPAAAMGGGKGAPPPAPAQGVPRPPQPMRNPTLGAAAAAPRRRWLPSMKRVVAAVPTLMIVLAGLFVTNATTTAMKYDPSLAMMFGYRTFSQAKGSRTGATGNLAFYFANITLRNARAKNYILDSRFLADVCILTEAHLALSKHGPVRKQFKKKGWKTYACPAISAAEGGQ
ncbi:unnamed protein product, partial [Prorocentrum cordatum]